MMALHPAPQRLAGTVAAAMLLTALAGPLPAVAQTGAQTKSDPKTQTKAQAKPGAKLTVAARARLLLRARRPVQALKALQPAVKAKPNDLTLLFLVGRAGLAAAGRKGIDDKNRTAFLDAAIAALRRMLVIRPGLVRARLELARAFFLKREDTLARRHFERVLAGKPPPAVVANVGRYLGAIRARKRWSAYFGFALAPDTNVGAASDADTVWLPAFGTVLPFRISDESRPSSGIGLLVWGGGEYQHPVGERLRLRVGGDLWRQEYAHSRFDRMLIAGHAGPRWLAGRTYEFSLLASARQILSARRVRIQRARSAPGGRPAPRPAPVRARNRELAPADLRGQRRPERTALAGVAQLELAGDADALRRRERRLFRGRAARRLPAQHAPLGAGLGELRAAVGFHGRRVGQLLPDDL